MASPKHGAIYLEALGSQRSVNHGKALAAEKCTGKAFIAFSASPCDHYSIVRRRIPALECDP